MKRILYSILLLAVLVPSVSLAAFDVSLKYGSRGDAVTELQDFLKTDGYLTSKVDGRFGYGTLRAVKTFQSSNGLTPDGYFGIASRTKVKEILGADLDVSDNAELKETGAVSTPSVVDGCAQGNVYSTKTGQPCNSTVSPIPGLPEGCTALSGYSITTGKKCSGEVVQPVIDQATQEKLTALNAQIQSLSSALNTIAQNTAPVITALPPIPPAKPAPQPLYFTKAPKLLYVGLQTNPDDFSFRNQSKVLYETNRPSKIVFGPIINIPPIYGTSIGTIEWYDVTGGSSLGQAVGTPDQVMTRASCGRDGGVSPESLKYLRQFKGDDYDITCTIRAQADDGATAEAKVSIANDSIVVPTIDSPYNY